MDAIRGVTEGYPGLTQQVQTYQPERVGQALTGVDHDMVVRVYGHEFDVLRAKAEEIAKIVAQTSGVVNARVDLAAEEPQIEIEVDLAKAEQHHVKPGDVRRAASTLLAGLQVGSLYEGQKVFDVVVWGVPEIRNNLTDIRELLIDTPSGELVRIGDVADVRIAPTPVNIRRETVSRFVDVVADVQGRSIAAVTADIQGRIKAIDYPLEYHSEVLNASAEQQAAQQRMLVGMGIALVGIYLLLQAAFGSWLLAFLVLITLPMALSGGVIAALAGGGVLSLGSLFGLLAVLGIAVRGNLKLINHFRRLEMEEGETFGPALVLRGARDQVAPIVMTALATGLAMLPLIVGGGLQGHEVVAPMAAVILGGLVTATVLTLFVVPAIYLRFGYVPATATAPVPYATAGAAAD
jgi:Cu/Ag efflux pump CusA